jgi:hypothetical protein
MLTLHGETGHTGESWPVAGNPALRWRQDPQDKAEPVLAARMVNVRGTAGLNLPEERKLKLCSSSRDVKAGSETSL